MINAEYFRLAHRFVAAVGTPKPSLAGVLIEPCAKGGVTIVATDTHVLAAFWDPLGFTPIARCIRTKGTLPVKGWCGGSVVTFEKGSATVMDGSGESGFAQEYDELDAFSYPDWRKVAGVDAEGDQIADGAGFYVDQLAKFAFKGKQDRVLLRAWDATRPVHPHLVTHMDYPAFIGAIYPIRVDGNHMKEKPSWLS